MRSNYIAKITRSRTNLFYSFHLKRNGNELFYTSLTERYFFEFVASIYTSVNVYLTWILRFGRALRIGQLLNCRPRFSNVKWSLVFEFLTCVLLTTLNDNPGFGIYAYKVRYICLLVLYTFTFLYKQNIEGGLGEWTLLVVPNLKNPTRLRTRSTLAFHTDFTARILLFYVSTIFFLVSRYTKFLIQDERNPIKHLQHSATVSKMAHAINTAMNYQRYAWNICIKNGVSRISM